MKKDISVLFPERLKMFLIEHRYINKAFLGNYRKILESSVRDSYRTSIDSPKRWIRNFLKLTYAYPELLDVGIEFFQSDFQPIHERAFDNDKLIAICIEKNDSIKIKKFIEYHRSLGVEQFAIVDNDSNDGSLEWLAEQHDVSLYKVSIPYTTNRREAWVNRLIAHYGLNRWYLILDSDEFLTYQDCEHKTINDFIKECESKGLKRIRALMLDMYAHQEFYKDGDCKSFYEECVYFDSNTYRQKAHNRLDLVIGGPRERIFGQAPWLTKYPLVYFSNDDIECKSHFLFPFSDNLHSKCLLALKHYKFLPGELIKYKDIVKKGNYYDGSTQYKKYVSVMDNNVGLDFFCDSTLKYTDSSALKKIDVMDMSDD